VPLAPKLDVPSRPGLTEITKDRSPGIRVPRPPASSCWRGAGR
jgi:hypothetical protein